MALGLSLTWQSKPRIRLVIPIKTSNERNHVLWWSPLGAKLRTTKGNVIGQYFMHEYEAKTTVGFGALHFQCTSESQLISNLLLRTTQIEDFVANDILNAVDSTLEYHCTWIEHRGRIQASKTNLASLVSVHSY